MGGAGAQQPQDANQANEAGQQIAKSVGQNVAGTANAEAGELIREFQKVWGPHYAALQNERLKKINEMAAYSTYSISLNVPSDEMIENPITGKQEKAMTDRWEHKVFKRQKLNQSNWIAIEEMKAELVELDDRLEKVKLYNKIQESQAFLYLGMKPEEYRRCDWEEMQLILLACTHRTRHGLPNSAIKSNSSSTQGAVA
jgi:hypothetical protein